MQLTSLSLALTRAGFLSAFSPARLFALGEQGAWFDPSDLGSLWQDSAGTTPVTAVEQPVGLMLDKSKGLVLGGDVVVNGGFDTDTFWTKGTGWSISNGLAVASNAANMNEAGVLTIGKWYLASVVVSSYSSGPLYVGTLSNLKALPTGTGTKTAVFLADTTTLYMAGLGAFTGSIDNISVRELPGNHATQTTSTSRPVLSARVNLLTKTEQFDDGVWVKSGGTITANAIVAPDGTLTADLFTESATNERHWIVRDVSASSANATFTFSRIVKKKDRRYCFITLNSASGTYRYSPIFDLDTGATVAVNTTGSPSGASNSIVPLGDGWFRISASGTNGATGFTEAAFGLSNSATPSLVVSSPAYAGDGTSGIYVWGASLVPANQSSLPYQRVNTATDYDTVGFPSGETFDGSDDYQTASSGGGSTTAFFWCSAIMVRKVGSAQTLFSDTGTNTGYRVRINASNQLEISAGNGSAYTTVATTATLAYGQIAVLTAWHDGTNLNVQIDNGTVHQTAFATASAGTASLTIGRDNGAASSYAGIRLFEKVYLKDSVPSAGDIAKTKTYVGATAGMTI